MSGIFLPAPQYSNYDVDEDVILDMLRAIYRLKLFLNVRDSGILDDIACDLDDCAYFYHRRYK